MKKSILLLMLISVFIYSVSFAEEIIAPKGLTASNTPAPVESTKPRFDVGVGYWYTWASLDTTLIATEDLPGLYLRGDKISELNYNTNAGLLVVNAEAYLFWRLYIDGFVAIGDMRDADSLDSDWLMQITQDKWLESEASAEGDVTNWNINGYFRIIEGKEDKGFLDVSAGYIYYRDNISSMTDLVYKIFYWTDVNLPIDGLDSSDKYTFDGLRLGARGRLKVHDRIALKLSGGIYPWLNAEEIAFWNLREMDIKANADAFGFDINAGVEFKINKNLFFEVGYRYINISTDRGDYTHTIDGIDYEFKDGWDSTDVSRGGVYAMGRLKI